jgi:hypothetical protein
LRRIKGVPPIAARMSERIIAGSSGAGGPDARGGGGDAAKAEDRQGSPAWNASKMNACKMNACKMRCSSRVDAQPGKCQPS